MRLDTSCRLAPALCKMLQIAICHGTTEDNTLAELLCYSTKTVHTYWQRACESLDTHSRFGVAVEAAKRGWVQFPGPDGCPQCPYCRKCLHP